MHSHIPSLSSLHRHCSTFERSVTIPPRWSPLPIPSTPIKVQEYLKKNVTDLKDIKHAAKLQALK